MKFFNIFKWSYGLSQFILIAALLSSCATTSVAIQHNTANEKYPQLPVILDGKGLFVVSKKKASRLKIKSVKVSDWSFGDKGKLVDRNRSGLFEYDNTGNILEFSGHKDRVGYIKTKFIYIDNNLSERRLNIKTEHGFKHVSKKSFNYIDSRQEEIILFDNNGVIKARRKLVYDAAGNNIKIHDQDANGNDIGTITKKFDKFGNILEKKARNGKVIYSYDRYKITVSQLMQNNQLHSTTEYTFDKDWNLLSYLRKSGNREYWDRFTYKYNADAVPIEKVWSRKEFIVQDPYQLTKYSYQHFK